MGEATGLPFLEKIMVGWEGIEEDGQELPFSKAMLKEFADDVDWLKSVLNAYTATYSRGRSGKLKDAAVYWVSGGEIVDDRTQEDAAAFGLKPLKTKESRVN